MLLDISQVLYIYRRVTFTVCPSLPPEVGGTGTSSEKVQ